VNKGELAVVYCFVFFYIFLRGFRQLEHRRDDGKGKSLGDDDGLAASEHRHPLYRQ